MSARCLVAVGLIAGALGACGGRAADSGTAAAVGGTVSEAPDPDAGLPASARGGSGTSAGSGRAHIAGTGGASFDAGTGDAGAGGAFETGGAPRNDEAGAGNLAGSSAGTAGACANRTSRFATEVMGYSFGGGQNFNQATGFPKAVFGPPAAGNSSAVVSLGNGGWVVLGFSGNAIVDLPGTDFTVFENPLPTFPELATVAVSDDGQHWSEFPCTAPQNASDFGSCAGVGVVYSSPTNGIDPLDPAVSGGDHYDLADIGVEHARFVRITDRADLDGAAGVFDLDALAIVHAECP